MGPLSNYPFTGSLPCQNLGPTLPTMQLEHGQFSKSVVLAAANVASSRDAERATEV